MIAIVIGPASAAYWPGYYLNGFHSRADLHTLCDSGRVVGQAKVPLTRDGHYRGGTP